VRESASEPLGKRKRRKDSTDAPAAPSAPDPHQPHDFRVRLEAPGEDAGDAPLAVAFAFVPALQVVTAAALDAASARVLDSLHACDDGASWPHDVNRPSHDAGADLHLSRLPGKPYK